MTQSRPTSKDAASLSGRIVLARVSSRARRLMHIDPYSLDRSGRFRRESTTISNFPQRRHGHGTRSRNLPGGIVRYRGRSLPERHRTPHARLWWSACTDERLRGAVPGSGGTVAQRRTLGKRAWHPPVCAQTSETFVPKCAHTERFQPSPETPVGSVYSDPRRHG